MSQGFVQRLDQVFSERTHLSEGFRYGASQLACPVDPVLHRILDVPQGALVIVTVRHAPGQLGRLGDDSLIFVAPIENDLVPAGST